MVIEAARILGVQQLPFEWEGRDEFYRKTRYFERQGLSSKRCTDWMEARAETHPGSLELAVAEQVESVQRAQSLLNQLAPASVINSGAYDSVIKTKHSLGDILAQLLEDHAELAEVIADSRFFSEVWRVRNQAMADNIIRIASQFPGRRLVATTGSEHRYILRELLADNPNIVLKEHWEVLGEV